MKTTQNPEEMIVPKIKEQLKIHLTKMAIRNLGHAISMSRR